MGISFSQYIGQSQKLSWSNHEALCLWQYDSHLASIHDSSQNTAAYNARTDPPKDCWIGLNRIGSSNINDLQWSDESDFDYGDDLNGGKGPWNSNEPNDDGGNEECVEIKNSDEAEGNWNDEDCSTTNIALCNSPSPIYIFQDNDNYSRVPLKGNIIGMIDILDEIYIGFHFILHSWSISQWTSVLCLDQDKEIEVYIDNLNHILFIEIDTVAYYFYEYEFGISLLIQYHIEILFTQNRFIFTVDNAVIFDDPIESHSILMDRKIYLSYTNFDAANATITGLTISTSNTHYPTPYNYLCDFNNRFTIVSETWNYNASNCEVESVNGGTGNVIWMGTEDGTSMDWTDYKVETIFNLQSGEGKAGILIRSKSVASANNGGQQYEVSTKLTTKEVRIAEIDNGDYNQKNQKEDVTFQLNTDYTLRVEAVSNKFYVYLDNEYMFQIQDSTYSHGSIGLRTHKTTAIFKSLRITFPTDGYLITVDPTNAPSDSPTTNPTNNPSQPPSMAPSVAPTRNPTNIPSQAPSMTPSVPPTMNPTNNPSQPPSNAPSMAPSIHPTNIPSQPPSIAPSMIPTISPSISPTLPPTAAPSLSPSKMPTQAEGEVIIKTTESDENDEGLNDKSNDNEQLSNMEYIIIIVAAVLAVIILILIGFIFVYGVKKKRNNIERTTVELTAKTEIMSETEGHIDMTKPIDIDIDEELYDKGNVITPNGISHNMHTSGNDVDPTNNHDIDSEIDNEDDLDELYVNSNTETPQNITRE